MSPYHYSCVSISSQALLLRCRHQGLLRKSQPGLRQVPKQQLPSCPQQLKTELPGGCRQVTVRVTLQTILQIFSCKMSSVLVSKCRHGGKGWRLFSLQVSVQCYCLRNRQPRYSPTQCIVKFNSDLSKFNSQTS